MSLDGDYTARCARVMEELHGSDRIEVERSEQQPATIDLLTDPDWVFSDIAERTGMQLSASVRDYFFASERMQAFWYDIDDLYLRGEFCLKPLHWSLLREHVPQDDLKTLSDAEKDLLGQLRIIDQETMAGSGRMTALRVTPHTDNPEIWFYDMNRSRLDLLDLEYGRVMQKP